MSDQQPLVLEDEMAATIHRAGLAGSTQVSWLYLGWCGPQPGTHTHGT